MLRRVVNGKRERGTLPGNTSDMHNRLRVTGARGRRRAEEMCDRQLRDTDGMRQIDVDGAIPIAEPVILRLRASWRIPEVGPVGLEHPRAGADDVDGSELLHAGLEHVLEICPRGDIGFLEHRLGAGLVLVDQRLRLRPQCDVCKYDIRAVLEQQPCEF